MIIGIPSDRRSVVLACTLAVAWCALAGPEARGEARPYVFGMGHYLAAWAGQPWSYDDQAMAKMEEMGATAVWIDFPWSSMESTEGAIDWSYADHQVDTAEAHGLEMFAYVGTTPQWAKLYPLLPAHRTPPSEDHIAQFTNFHTQLAARYAGRVTYFQFWNEPSGCSWINEGCSNGGDCTLFTLWQQRAYDALKAGNPACVVSTGGFDGDPAGYVQCMYTNGGGTGFDAVSIHPYAPGGTGGKGTSGEGIDYSDLDQVRQVMVDHGDAAKKIWITEYGWNTTDEARRAADLEEVLTEFKQPQYNYLFYAKHLVLNDWDDNDGDPSDGDFCCYGLTDEAFNPKPAFDTFKNFDKTFPDTVEFTADVTAGSAPLTVQFTDQSSVDGTIAWLWEFGDGTTSPLQNPEHTYTTNGEFTVRLTVTGTNGPFVEEKIEYILVSDFVGLTNPSYEDPLGFLNGWSSCLAGGSSIKHNPSTHVPSPAFHDGINSAGMSSGRAGDDLGAGAIWQEVAVDPGRTYHIRCWGFVTASLDTTYDYANDLMQLRVRDGSGSALSCINNGQGIESNSQLLAASQGIQNPQWLLFEGQFTPTQNVMTVIAYWKFSGSDYMNNSLHLDDWDIIDVTPPRAPADFDEDGDVDDNDWITFSACLSGPALPYATGCADRDFDGDSDVDLTDFAVFQRCMTGFDIPADPNCAD